MARGGDGVGGGAGRRHEEAERADAVTDCVHLHVPAGGGGRLRRLRVRDGEEALGGTARYQLILNFPISLTLICFL